MSHRDPSLSLKCRFAFRIIFLLVGCQGCTSYDEAAWLADGLRLGGGWHAAEPTKFSVPGDPLRAWEGANGESLILYRSLPAPASNARAMAEEFANRLMNLPGASNVEGGTLERGELQLARVDAVAPGDGKSWAPSGLGTPVESRTPLIPTHLRAAGLARPAGTYWLVSYYPEADRAVCGTAFDDAIASWPPKANQPQGR
jgi:hypothetical protein